MTDPRSWRRWGVVLLVATLPLAGGCATTGINAGDFSIVSVDEEWQLGEQLSADVAKQMKVIDSPEINAYVTAIGEKILAQARNDSPTATRPWHFHVIQDSTLNAFNIPGGHVYVNSGLVAAAGNYSELALVMGHEVSHGLARHGVENMTKAYGISLIASLVLGKNPAAYQEIVANIVAGGTLMKFSRDAEREADRLGIHYAYAAGIDPMGMVTFFEKLKAVEGSRPSAVEQFFSSHPLTDDRIQAARQEIQGLAAKPLEKDDPGFAGFQKRVAQVAGRP
jgi:predicted Zn-dependent protease